MNLRGTKTLHDYLKHWNIQQPIFQNRVTHEELFLTEKWRMSLERFLLFAGRPASLGILTSPRGHCKSSLLNWLYHKLEVSSHEVTMLSLFDYEAESGWLLRKLGQHFGCESQDKRTLLESIGEAIDDMNQIGKIFTVLIDEAHKIVDPQGFTEIHSLISVNSLRDSGVNFILAGDPFLLDMIRQTPDLKNRVQVSIRFEALNFDDCSRYINGRLTSCNINPRIIDPEGFKEIFRLTQGLFAKMNSLLENAFIEAYLSDQRVIDVATLRAAASYSFLAEPESHDSRESHKNQAGLGSIHQKIETSVAGHSRKHSQGNESKTNQSSVELSSLFYKSDDK